ncbi:MAG: UDP-N-acetylglucosamine 2-epimerase [Acidobacteriota bacterium]|nr:UDP-N-acetylglucosamine 2-epimerase [Acidobacteriota bacterium]
MSQRKIAVLTTSRADYGHLYWPLHELRQQPDIDVRLLVTGAHLSPEFGQTVREIKRDGFPIEAEIECLLSSDSDVGMAKTIGLATLSLADVLGRLRPDILLLIADRYEMLAPAATALALRIPIAHIEGGDVSEGAVDDAVRNALTKMSHLHFTPTEQARRRVLAMGEESWRVIRSGAPSLDHLKRQELPTRNELSQRLQLDLEQPTVVVAYHPVTLQENTLAEAEAVFRALALLPYQIAFCFPNADAGSRALIRRAEEFCGQRSNAELFVNLNHLTYWSLLKRARLLLGNSSSGIMESPSLALPTVNIGMRQQGRERAANVIDVPAQTEVISAAVEKGLSSEFRQGLQGMINPYGDGTAGQIIARTLAQIPLGEKLLVKKALPLDEHGAWIQEDTRGLHT